MVQVRFFQLDGVFSNFPPLCYKQSNRAVRKWQSNHVAMSPALHLQYMSNIPIQLNQKASYFKGTFFPSASILFISLAAYPHQLFMGSWTAFFSAILECRYCLRVEVVVLLQCFNGHLMALLSPSFLGVGWDRATAPF